MMLLRSAALRGEGDRPVRARGILAEALWVWVVSAAAFVVWALAMGRDVNWDTLNYHLYLGLSANGARMALDFLPANVQSYLAPYGYWALSQMVLAQWPAWAVLSVLALIQSPIGVALWMVARAVFPAVDAQGTLNRVLCVVAGLASPVLMSQIGSTFVDLTASIFIVLSVALLLWGTSGWLSWRRAVIASAAVAGLACTIKLTSVPLVVLLPVLILAGQGAMGKKVLRAGQFSACALTAFVVSYAPWGYALWQARANPFFPFFNRFFASPDFPTGGFGHDRFRPQSIEELIAWPISMAEPYTFSYHEIASPDVRPLWLFSALSLIVALWLARRWSSSRTTTTNLGELHNQPVPSQSLALRLLALYVVCAWFTWLAWSGNGRYFVAGLALIGPVVVGLLLGGSMPASLGRVLVALMFVAQCVMGVNATTYRWARDLHGDLSAPFFKPVLSESLSAKPATFLTTKNNSMSHLAISANPRSHWMNLVGQYTVAPDGPGAGAAQSILSASSEIYIVMSTTTYQADLADPKHTATPPDLKTMRNLYRPFGADPTGECVLSEDAPEASQVVLLHPNGTKYGHKLWFCKATYSAAVREQALAWRKSDPWSTSVEAALNRIEKACPRLFSPQDIVHTMYIGDGATRNYMNTDITLSVFPDGKISYKMLGSYRQFNVGTVNEVVSGHFDVAGACGAFIRPYELPWRRQ